MQSTLPIITVLPNFSLDTKLSGSTVVAGLIVFLLGVVGLLQLFGVAIIPFDLAVVSAFLTVTGAIILFGAIALVGIVLIVSGLATVGEPRRIVEPAVVQPVVVAAPVAAGTVVAAPAARVLSDLELVTLRDTSQGKSAREIASATGVSEPIVMDKVAMLRAEGYLTDKNTLTEKGYEVLRVADQRPVYTTSPAP